jgi:hypothetical protein
MVSRSQKSQFDSRSRYYGDNPASRLIAPGDNAAGSGSSKHMHQMLQSKQCTGLLFNLFNDAPGYRSRVPVSIPGSARFSEKQWVWNGVHSASRVQLRSYLEAKVTAPN